MEFKEVLYSRRSTRSFTDRPVSREEIDALLDAAINAPSACNMQSWHFYVVTDECVKKRFAEEGVCAAWVCTAPVIFVVCTDGQDIISRFGERAERLFVIQDTAAACENMLLTAVDMGLGGCWIGSFNEEKCAEILSIPQSRRVAALIPIGQPSQHTPSRGRKPLSDAVTYI